MVFEIACTLIRCLFWVTWLASIWSRKTWSGRITLQCMLGHLAIKFHALFFPLSSYEAKVFQTFCLLIIVTNHWGTFKNICDAERVGTVLSILLQLCCLICLVFQFHNAEMTRDTGNNQASFTCSRIFEYGKYLSVDSKISLSTPIVFESNSSTCEYCQQSYAL